MIPGLDEFMLRLGHLKVLSNVATETGGSRHRVEKATAEILTSETTVPPEEIPALTEYLYNKRLCVIQPNKVHASEALIGQEQQVRYPELVVRELGNGDLDLTDGKAAIRNATVWWQDRCLAHPEIPSKVGAVTALAKMGSKTGLSHIFDWAEVIGLISSTAQATPEAKLFAKLDAKCQGEVWTGNPYVLGNDKILIGFILLHDDLDLFSRFVVALTSTTWPLKKRQAAQLFTQTLIKLVDEANQGRDLTVRQKFHLTEQLHELERTARRKHKGIELASTTWHRTASRLESYVDIGILTKQSEHSRDRFEYTYYAAPPLSAVAETVQSESDPIEWLEVHLVDCLLGCQARHEILMLDEMHGELSRLVATIASPTASYQIDTLAVGLARIFADTNSPISIRCGRRSLEELARSHPEVARVARGSVGPRAEYISLDRRKL